MLKIKDADSKLKELALELGQFFFKKNNECYSKTREEIQKLGITDLRFGKDGRFEIHLTRPGVLIGLRGEQIEKITEFLNCKIHIVESDSWSDFITPYDYSKYDSIDDI